MAKARVLREKISTVIFSLYVGWTALATFELVDWPGQFVTFFAGMQFHALASFMFVSWIVGEPDE